MITFKEYQDNFKQIENIISESVNSDGTVEITVLLEGFTKNNICIETVMTSDIAQVTPPLSFTRRKKPNMFEELPDDEEIRLWVSDNTSTFKKQYKSDWKNVLYACAWELYDSK